MFPWQIANFFSTIWSWHVDILTEEREKQVDHIKKENGGSQTVLTVLLFVALFYILIHGKEKWILV